MIVKNCKMSHFLQYAPNYWIYKRIIISKFGKNALIELICKINLSANLMLILDEKFGCGALTLHFLLIFEILTYKLIFLKFLYFFHFLFEVFLKWFSPNFFHDLDFLLQPMLKLIVEIDKSLNHFFYKV